VEFFAWIIVLAGAVFLYRLFASDSSERENTTSSGTNPSSSRSQTTHQPTQKTFKPSSARRERSRGQRSRIKFNQPADEHEIITCAGCGKNLRVPSGRKGIATCRSCDHKNDIGSSNSKNAEEISRQSFDGIVDAFTGLPINFDSSVYTCSCGVAYQQDSYEVIKSENGSSCMACRQPNISLYQETPTTTYVGEPARKGRRKAPRNYDPNAVTLSNYRSFENTVVTFQGRVERVQQSRRGTDYAVMFEDKSWVKGFKLVFFKGSVKKVGGARYIKSLLGKTIKVRGLLIQHERFGYEIIINDRSMILSERI